MTHLSNLNISSNCDDAENVLYVIRMASRNQYIRQEYFYF